MLTLALRVFALALLHSLGSAFEAQAGVSVSTGIRVLQQPLSVGGEGQLAGAVADVSGAYTAAAAINGTHEAFSADQLPASPTQRQSPIWATVWTSLAADNGNGQPTLSAFKRHLAYAYALVVVFLIAHAGSSAWVAFNDITGRWNRYRLHQPSNKKQRDPAWRRWRLIMYFYSARCWPLQILGILPFSLAFLTFKWANVYTVERFSIVTEVIKGVLGYYIGNLWLALAHRILHVPALYIRFHKEHHVPVAEMVGTASWLSSTPEFLMMELPGSFLLAAALRPHWVTLALVWAVTGVGGTMNHSGFTIGDWWDSSYHYMHHAVLRCNYAELDFIDKLAGTYRPYVKHGPEAK